MRENREENLIADLFSKQGYSVLKEPDGNIPPDIVLNGTIAVEVTRLSKVIEVESVKKSIDNDSSSVIAKLKKAINTCDEYINYKYSVHVILKRPLGNIKKLILKIKTQLREIEENGLQGDSERFNISGNLTVKVIKRNVDSGNGFLLIGISDLDANDHDKAVMLQSVRFCHSSKIKKVKPYLDRYTEWWLVLSDTITYNGSEEYKDYLSCNLCKEPFSRIIFVNSLIGDVISEI